MAKNNICHRTEGTEIRVEGQLAVGIPDFRLWGSVRHLTNRAALRRQDGLVASLPSTLVKTIRRLEHA